MRLSRRLAAIDVAAARRDGNEGSAFLLGLVGRSARNVAEVTKAGDIITKPWNSSNITLDGIGQDMRP